MTTCGHRLLRLPATQVGKSVAAPRHTYTVQPQSFDEQLMTDWSLWVLDHEFPDLPERLQPSEAAPIAGWAGQVRSY